MKDKQKLTILLIGVAILFLFLHKSGEPPAAEAFSDFSLDGAGDWWDGLSDTMHNVFYAIGVILFITIIVNMWFSDGK